MGISKLARELVVLAAAVVLGATAASAQATRTWVSGVGDDANPCSRTAPCKTFAGAISKTAADGVIDVLDPGGYGAVTITKAITIEAVGTVAGVLVAGTNGIVVNAGSTDRVVLRGLTFEGLGTGLNGVDFVSGLALFVENCRFHRFTQWAIKFEPGSVGTLVVDNTTIRDDNFGPQGGILVQPGASASARATLSNVHIERCGEGVEAMDNSTVTIRDSAVSKVAGEAMLALSSSAPSTLVVDGVLASDSGTGVKAQGSQAVVRLARATFTGNTAGIASVSGGQVVSVGNNANFDSGTPTSTIPQQ